MVAIADAKVIRNLFCECKSPALVLAVLLLQVGGSVCLAPVVAPGLLSWRLPLPHCSGGVKYWVILLCVR